VLPLTRLLARIRPFRTSRRRFGIPDAHDALAVYLRWVRQAHYLRADAPGVASSVMAAGHSHQSPPPVVTASMDVDVEHDLTGVGAWADAGRIAEIEGYPGELDLDILG
jgi:hypothetical protein